MIFFTSWLINIQSNLIIFIDVISFSIIFIKSEIIIILVIDIIILRIKINISIIRLRWVSYGAFLNTIINFTTFYASYIN